MKKISEEEAQQILKRALAETDEKRVGEFYQPLESVKTQLEYLLNALSHPNDRAKLCDINLGRYAAYEFEPGDPTYAATLYEAANVGRLMLKGRI